MSLFRLGSLIVKEAKQLLRDPFSFILGILLPIAMLLICGYGMSTDIRNIRLAILIPDPSDFATEIAARFQASDYFDVEIVRSSAEGEELVRSHRADACLFLPQETARRLHGGDAQILIALNASNPSLAYTKESYIRSVLLTALTRPAKTERRTDSAAPSASGSRVNLQPRLWFNDANASALTLIPGIIAVIMTVVGVLLTAMVMAREYEQGNLESLFVTPTRSSEILLAKTAVHFALGMLGLGISLFLAHRLFHVPIRAGWYVIPLGSSVFLVTAQSMGLLISSLTKNQFIAVEIAAFASFLPSFLLSGFLFEIKSMPTVLQWITLLVPARYYVDFLQTAFLVGDVWPNFIKNIGILSMFAAGFMILAKLNNPKRLEG